MAKIKMSEARESVEDAITGMLETLKASRARRHAYPSSSGFKITLQQPQPSDPRAALPSLKETIARFTKRNDRLELGLKVGFRRAEQLHGKSEGHDQ